jgi:signal transduction histidine kinase/CheY-like chemotaxis protein
MTFSLITVRVHHEQDVVLARQRARQVAALLQFDTQDQVRIATAVSEIARNAYLYAKGGRVEFTLTDTPARKLQITIADKGPGIEDLQRILDGRYSSRTGMGLGIVGARRLMDEFELTSSKESGTQVVLAKHLPTRTPQLTPRLLARLAEDLTRIVPSGPLAELQSQNQDLLRALDELGKRQTELAELNQELEYTNRGVVALYAELDERADYLRRTSELKTQFLSNMTHEFRTPLNAILSLSRILLDRIDGELTSEQVKQVEFIRQAASDLSEIVNDLLDLAKVEAGKVTVRPAEFEIRDLFGALRGMLRPLLVHNSSVKLEFDDPLGITANTDQSKVSQIVRNLLSNALKYTERGEVRVHAALEEQGLLVLTVSDTGVGISPADHERIFEEFTQVEGEHQTGKRGTGLGLPLSRRLAELLGGTLTVSSTPGLGSTFTLRIPAVYTGPGEVSIAPELDAVIDPTRLPVLVVEDNRETLLVYEKYLKGTPYQVVTAHTVAQAREALGRCQPVALVLDILLAHENTWSFLIELKQEAKTRSIPVLVITMVENEHKARALGADDFHAKPIDRQWLLAQLEKRCHRNGGDEVLVIDDEAVSRYILSGLLQETRFHVLQSDNGRDGLRLAVERQPTAIFLDLAMPEMDGYQVLEALKANPATAAIPVIVHTASALTEQQTQRLAPQTLAVLPKAHTDRQLSLRRIREALAKAYDTKQRSNHPGR